MSAIDMELADIFEQTFASHIKHFPHDRPRLARLSGIRAVRMALRKYQDADSPPDASVQLLRAVQEYHQSAVLVETLGTRGQSTHRHAVNAARARENVAYKRMREAAEVMFSGDDIYLKGIL